MVSCTRAGERSPNPFRYLTGSGAADGWDGAGLGGRGAGGLSQFGEKGGFAFGTKRIPRNVTGHLNGENQTTDEEKGKGVEGEGGRSAGGCGLIKSAAQTAAAAAESSELPNLVLYPPKY